MSDFAVACYLLSSWGVSRPTATLVFSQASEVENMAHEVQEIAERAGEPAHDPIHLPVTITMAILAVFVAAVGLQSHRAHTEEVVLQNKASDQWQHYQAKNTRRHTYELFLDLLPVLDLKDGEQTTKVREKYLHEVERNKEDQNEIEAVARGYEKELTVERSKANRFDLGEVCLEAALVIVSMTLLTKRKTFWGIGMAVAVLGLGIALTGLWVG